METSKAKSGCEYSSSLQVGLLTAWLTCLAPGAAGEAKQKPYQNKEIGFRLSYPPELSQMKSPTERTIVYLGTKSDGEKDIFRESVQFKVEAKNLKNATLAQAAAGLVGSMEKAGIKVTESSEDKLGGRPAQRITYTNRLKLPNGEVQAKGRVYLQLRDGTAYGLDVRATEETFDAFLPIAQKVIESFEWIAPAATTKSSEEPK